MFSSFALSLPQGQKERPKRRLGPVLRRLFLLFLDVKDFFAVVIPAFGANAVGADHRAAMGASDQSDHFELEVGPAQSFAGLAGSSLRYCHK